MVDRFAWGWGVEVFLSVDGWRRSSAGGQHWKREKEAKAGDSKDLKSSKQQNLIKFRAKRPVWDQGFVTLWFSTYSTYCTVTE